jgi:hypothetical protein
LTADDRSLFSERIVTVTISVAIPASGYNDIGQPASVTEDSTDGRRGAGKE